MTKRILYVFFTAIADKYALFSLSGGQFCCVSVLWRVIWCKGRIDPSSATIHMSLRVRTFFNLVNVACVFVNFVVFSVNVVVICTSGPPY